jgi:hypothetical protein
VCLVSLTYLKLFFKAKLIFTFLLFFSENISIPNVHPKHIKIVLTKSL